jgi:hypothetical protein
LKHEDSERATDLGEIRDTTQQHVDQVRKRRDIGARWARLNLALISLRIKLHLLSWAAVLVFILIVVLYKKC